MKKGLLAIIVFFGFFAFCQEILVFNDGRTLKIPGPYTIKGKFLQYQDEHGGLMQLPLKLIDLEKSKQATQAHLAALEAEKAKAEEVLEEPKEKSLTDVADYVKSRRGEGDVSPSDVKITSEDVSSFGADNPLPENEVIQSERVESSMSPSDVQKEAKSFQESYKNIQKEIDDLDAKIQTAEDLVIAMQNQLTYGDDPTSKTYDSMEKGEKEVEKLKEERKKKVQEQKRVKKNAAKMGIKNVGRKKQKPKPKRKRDEPESYQEEEGAFEYKEEDNPD